MEKVAPDELPDNSVTILHARGSTYFAAVRTIQDMLPSAKKANNAVVIIRIRGIDQVGSTMIAFMERYEDELHANGGKLMLSGVRQNVLDQLLRTETTEVIPEDRIFMATDTLGESTKDALAAANAWLARDAIQVESNESEQLESKSDYDSGEQNP